MASLRSLSALLFHSFVPARKADDVQPDPSLRLSDSEQHSASPARSADDVAVPLSAC